QALAVAPCRFVASTEPERGVPRVCPATTLRRSETSRYGADLSYRILSTYPPTACGLATFTAALSQALVANGASARVVRVADGPTLSDPMVVGELENDVQESVARAIEMLSEGDVAIV